MERWDTPALHKTDKRRIVLNLFCFHKGKRTHEIGN
jgi:hypothetical protein